MANSKTQFAEMRNVYQEDSMGSIGKKFLELDSPVQALEILSNSNRTSHENDELQNNLVSNLESKATPLKCRDPNVSMQGNRTRRQSFSLPVTPKKKHAPSCIDDPLTPTANLKILMSAAFSAQCMPETKEKRNIFQTGDDTQEDSCSTVSDSVDDKEKVSENDEFDVQYEYGSGGSRKFKSLGLLCQKFLQKYPDDEEGKIINLHDIANDLQVERRRIYDIVNVLESLEYVVKKGKNTYIWHGSKRLVPTLRKLKALAHKLYVVEAECAGNIDADSDDATEKVPGIKVPKVWLRNGIQIPEQNANDLKYVNRFKKEEESKQRKNKSLGIFCQKLLMLFMVSKDQTVALERAAKEVIEIAEDPLGKNKTKVRRLYDIANILTSMHLIQKTVVFSGSRKTAFKWIGVDLNSLQPDTETLENTLSGNTAFAPTKHSLFSQPTALADLGPNSVRKFGARSFSANQIQPKKNKLPRTKSAAVISRKRSGSSDVTLPDSLPDSADPFCSGSDTGFFHNDVVADGAVTIDAENIASIKDICTEITSPEKPSGDSASPNEREFQEELKRLQQKYPDKMPQADDLTCLSSASIKEALRSSRCCLLNRIGNRNEEEPTAKKFKSVASQGVKRSTSLTTSDIDQAPIEISRGESAGLHFSNAGNGSSCMVGNIVAAPYRFTQKISIGVQTDSSSLEQNVTSTLDHGTVLVPSSVGNGSCNAAAKARQHPRVENVSNGNKQCMVVKPTNLRDVTNSDEQGNTVLQTSKSQQQRLATYMTSSTLQNLPKGDQVYHLIKLPSKFIVSDKENLPLHLAQNALYLNGNSNATSSSSLVKEISAKNQMQILPKPFRIDTGSEETPDRLKIQTNCIGVKAQRKLPSFGDIDS
eukprot:gene12749-14055_t